jgi:hypothetical protein
MLSTCGIGSKGSVRYVVFRAALSLHHEREGDMMKRFTMAVIVSMALVMVTVSTGIVVPTVAIADADGGSE